MLRPREGSELWNLGLLGRNQHSLPRFRSLASAGRRRNPQAVQGPCQGPHMVTSQSREGAAGSLENQGLGDVLCQLARETRDSRSEHQSPEFGCGRTLCSNEMLEKSLCT